MGLRRFPDEGGFGTCGLGESESQVDGRELPTGTVSQELQLREAQSPASGHLGSGCWEGTASEAG